jgi:hypothetical protein
MKISFTINFKLLVVILYICLCLLATFRTAYTGDLLPLTIAVMAYLTFRYDDIFGDHGDDALNRYTTEQIFGKEDHE